MFLTIDGEIITIENPKAYTYSDFLTLFEQYGKQIILEIHKDGKTFMHPIP